MLDQLVESKSHASEDTKRSGLLMTTFVVMASLLMAGWLYSLFAKDFGMGGDELALETLVAPPVVEEPEPEPEKEKEPQKDPNVELRKEIIAPIDYSPPDIPKVSTQKQNQKVWDPSKFTQQSDRDFSPSNAPPSDYKGPVNTSGTGSNSGATGGGGDDDTGGAPPPPPPIKKAPPKTISGGVLNGKATSLPKPPYPPAARAVRASGAVTVQVTIDETGRVVSAAATGGHPLLRAAAVAAARGARFSPTQLSGQPVKVTGIITYNFVP